MIERNKLGMILFILSEAVFFLLLILAYVFYHEEGGLGPTAANSLDVPRTTLFSLALFASSGSVWAAERALRGGLHRRFRIWLAVTLGLGLVFLIGQGTEYASLLERDITISRNLFGTTFFTLTSFHGLHVAVGLGLLAVLLGLATFGKRGVSPVGMESVSLYWHFVDAVWLAIFPVVYLWKYL